jgi:hypothetical protein
MISVIGCGVTLGEIAALKAQATALFRDTGKIGTASTPMGADPTAVTWTWGSTIGMGVGGSDVARASEAVDGSGASIKYDTIRLPLTSTVTSENRLQVISRDGATLTAPEYYRVVGDPTRGLTCLVARVKLINGGDAL